MSKSVPFEDREDIPDSYDTTHVRLIAREPFRVYTYWEIAPAAYDHVRNVSHSDLNGFVHTLRMYDVTCIDFSGSNANHWFDTDFSPEARDWYLNLWCDNVTYCAEVGMRAPDGTFYPMARSNTVATPRAGLSDRSEMVWMEKSEDKAPDTFIQVERSATAKQNNVPKPLKRTEHKQTKRLPLSAQEVKAYYAKLFPLLKAVRKPSYEIEAESRKWAAALGAKDVERSATIEDLMAKRLISRSSTDWAISSAQTGASEQHAGGASEQAQSALGRKFFFDLWTELTVYGRTEPDAEVRHGNKIVPLRDDGTFTLRFALSDGEIPLDFTATSFDKVEQRRITTSAIRTKTVYSP